MDTLEVYNEQEARIRESLSELSFEDRKCALYDYKNLSIGALCASIDNNSKKETTYKILRRLADYVIKNNQ